MGGPDDATISGSLFEPWNEIVLSAIDGYVWASWPGTSAAVRLGRFEAVLAMMQEFVDQSALGENLSRSRTAAAKG
jgi:hypothetical protein